MNQYKKILIFLGILAVLSPIGILLPEYLKSGKAWGEWSTNEVKEQTGTIPEGMKKKAEKYEAPLPGYNKGEENSLKKKIIYYFLSGILGAGIVIGISTGITRLLNKKQG